MNTVINGSPNDLNIPLIVKEVRLESSECFSLVFERPENLQYKSGNWMDIRFPSAELAIGKTFSFASAPSEPNIMITFKKGVSKFKRALENVQVGDMLFITQHGSNGFLIDKRYSSVFIAGGVGITPFRSMIKDVIDNFVNINITLIYINHSDFPFKNELDTWQQQLPFLTVRYLATAEQGRLSKEKLLHLVPDITEKIIYIAGSPSMIGSTKNMLTQIGVSEEEIKIDSFEGY